MESIKTLKKDLNFLYKIKEKLEDGIWPKELEFKKRGYNIFTLKLPSDEYLYPKDETIESVLEVIDKNIEIFQKLIAQYQIGQRKRSILMYTIEGKIKEILKEAEIAGIDEYDAIVYIYKYLDKTYD